MREGEAQRVEIVFEADDVQRAHRARVGLFLVAEDRGHGVGGGAEADIPDDERLRALRGFPGQKSKALGQI